MTLLVSLADYQDAVQSTSNPTVQTAAIEDASAAVLAYTDRDFSAAATTTTRTYQYDGQGVLEIDDCSAVNTCSLPGWYARTEGPSTQTIYTHLVLPQYDLVSHGAMGFTSNLDTILGQGYPYELDVSVNADWGWVTVPDDVQRAVIWTAAAFEADPTAASGSLASKSVAEVAEVYAVQQLQQSQYDNDPIPPRARSLLLPYRRIKL